MQTYINLSLCCISRKWIWCGDEFDLTDGSTSLSSCYHLYAYCVLLPYFESPCKMQLDILMQSLNARIRISARDIRSFGFSNTVWKKSWLSTKSEYQVERWGCSLECEFWTILWPLGVVARHSNYGCKHSKRSILNSSPCLSIERYSWSTI